VPLQNRVTPFGEIIALEQRGLFMGNRGIIHDPLSRTLLRRRWTNKAWIVCRCDFGGRRREVMRHRSWTELFFYDEAVALAAGHRPCWYCRRESALAFAAAWRRAHSLRSVTAAQIDGRLHAERLDARRQRIHALPAPAPELPDGTMVRAAGDAHVVVRGKMFRWSAGGYEKASTRARADALLTPPSTVATLRAGYVCAVHPRLLPWLE
jgi:hypothetical protein